jgi:UDP-N-acetylmuramate--alanine ligase
VHPLQRDKVEDKSQLFITKDLPLTGVTVAVDEDAVYSAFNVRIENGSYLFDIKTQRSLCRFAFWLPGKHNLMNALMAMQWLKYSEPQSRLLH